MKILINNNYLNVFITKKKSTKNTYIRVKEDLCVYVTCNTSVSDKEIESLLNNEKDKITNMYLNMKKRNKYNNTNYFLGEEFDIITTNLNTYYINKTLYLKKGETVEQFYKNKAKKLFKDRLEFHHNNFTYKLPSVTLRIRDMKTRWGVCNTKSHVITLNLDLIKRDIKALDYVIVHELAHLIHPNHSKEFWNVVEENYKDYKEVRKYLNSYMEEVC